MDKLERIGFASSTATGGGCVESGNSCGDASVAVSGTQEFVDNPVLILGAIIVRRRKYILCVCSFQGSQTGGTE